MSTIASQITSPTIVTQPIIQTQIKENIKGPHHWPLCGEFTGTGEFPAQMASNAENVSIWWRHHELGITRNQGIIGHDNDVIFFFRNISCFARKDMFLHTYVFWSKQ